MYIERHKTHLEKARNYLVANGFIKRKIVKEKSTKAYCCFCICSIFMLHQMKGGIHAIYRIFMETFGWYRLTGLLH